MRVEDPPALSRVGAMRTGTARAVRAGPRAYRRRLRRAGPFVALTLPAIALGVALALWQLFPCDGTECVRQGAAGWFLTALAVPTALASGVPAYGGAARYGAALASSAVAWMVVGWWAARRATRSPVASWRDWWREYAWLLAGVWAGVAVAAGVMVVALREGWV